MRVCSGPLTAPPGESNHGWGRAVDFKDNRNILTYMSSATRTWQNLIDYWTDDAGPINP